MNHKGEPISVISKKWHINPDRGVNQTPKLLNLVK